MGSHEGVTSSWITSITHVQAKMRGLDVVPYERLCERIGYQRSSFARRGFRWLREPAWVCFAVVLIDESHVTAHCYSDEGLLAIDVFTCGPHDPEHVVELIHEGLISEIEGVTLVRKERVSRF